MGELAALGWRDLQATACALAMMLLGAVVLAWLGSRLYRLNSKPVAIAAHIVLVGGGYAALLMLLTPQQPCRDPSLWMFALGVLAMSVLSTQAARRWFPGNSEMQFKQAAISHIAVAMAYCFVYLPAYPFLYQWLVPASWR